MTDIAFRALKPGPQMGRSLVKMDPEAALAKAAASEAVKDVVIDLVKQGVPDKQVKAIAAATEAVLIGGKGFEARAKGELSRAFAPDEAATLLQEIVQAAA